MALLSILIIPSNVWLHLVRSDTAIFAAHHLSATPVSLDTLSGITVPIVLLVCAQYQIASIAVQIQHVQFVEMAMLSQLVAVSVL